MRRCLTIAVVLVIMATTLCGASCETKSDVSAVIKAEDMTKSGGYWDIPVELTPSDAIEVDKVHSVELVSAEGYSFGRQLVSWRERDSRSIKEVSFQIPLGDKVASQLTDSEQEVWEKWFDSGNPAKGVELYRDAVGKILKVRIRTGDVVTVKDIRTVPDASASPNYYDIVVTLVPTELMVADYEYWMIELKWSVNGVEKTGSSGGFDGSWSQSELKSRTAKEVEIGNFNQDYCNRFLGGGSADFWSNQKYEVTFIPLI